MPELKGRFNFVSSNADKDGYIRSSKDLDARTWPGGCIVAHNALNDFAGVDRYTRHIQGAFRLRNSNRPHEFVRLRDQRHGRGNAVAAQQAVGTIRHRRN